MSFDKIHLKGITAKGYHGFYDTERAIGQDFVVDIVMDVDSTNACVEDDLRKTVDYGKVGRAVVRAIESEPVKLIETLAERIALVVLSFDNVVEVGVTVHKPQAPLEYDFKDVALSIVRNRSNLKVSFENSAYFIKRANFLEDEVNKISSEEFESALQFESIIAPKNIDNTVDIVENTLDDAQIDSLDVVEEEIFDEPEVTTDIIDVTEAGCNDFPPIFEPQKSSVVLALGGNLGNSIELFQDVISDLDKSLGFDVLDVSPLIKTKAQTLNNEEQPDYYNCVLRGETFLRPSDLLGLVKEVEYYFGRRDTGKWQPRIIDIDIISYNDQQYEDEELTIPHKLAKQRIFVLKPWYLMENDAELDGDKISDLLSKSADSDTVLGVWADWLGKTASELEQDSSEDFTSDLNVENNEEVRILDDDIDIFVGEEIYAHDSDEHFDDSADDLFYSDENLAEIERSTTQVEADLKLVDDLFEVDNAEFSSIDDTQAENKNETKDEIDEIFSTMEHTKVMNQLRTLFTNGVEDTDLLPNINSSNNDKNSLSATENSSVEENFEEPVRVSIMNRLNKHVGNYESEVEYNQQSLETQKNKQTTGLYEALRKKTFDEAMSVRKPNTPYTFKPKWQSLETGE